MKLNMLKTVVDPWLKVWLNIDGEITDCYLSVDDIPGEYDLFAVEYITIDGENELTIQVLSK